MNDTDDWDVLPERPDYRCKLITHGNITIRIFRPILTDEQRNKREHQIMSSVGRILRKYDIEEEV